MLQANVLDLFHGDNREKIPDFSALRINGIFAVIHKASQGLHYIDKTYAARRVAAERAGLLWGAYHFLTSESDGTEQAKFFIDTAKPDENTLLACDFEKSSATPSLQQCRDFMAYVDQNSPASCVLYSGDLIRETLRPHAGGFQQQAMNGAEMFFAQHRLWLAEYGPHANPPWPWNDEKIAGPWAQPFLWQFSGSGRVNPIVGAVDLNYYAGDFETLKANWLMLASPTPNPVVS